jgi:hypothetical protein
MEDTNATPPIVAMGGANDTVPEFDCSHLSTITVYSAKETPLHLNPEAPTGVHATPHLAMDRVGEPPTVDCSVGPTMNYETHHDTGCQYQATYSNNTGIQGNHRLAAVSNIAATGPGESGPCGFLPADTVPTAVGGLGLRETTSTGMVPTSTHSLGLCGKPPADTDLNAGEWMGPRETSFTMAAPSSNTNTTKVPYGENAQVDQSQKGGQYSDDLVASGAFASGASHCDGGDRSGPVPGHAPPQHAHDTVDADTSGDRSGPVPGHAPHQNTHSGARPFIAVHADTNDNQYGLVPEHSPHHQFGPVPEHSPYHQYGPVPDYAPHHQTCTGVQHSDGSIPDYTPHHQARIGVQHSDGSIPDYTPHHQARTGVQH